MAEVFTQKEKDIFKLAKRLQLIGENELSTKLCKELVRSAAAYDTTEDILALFYGDRVYEKLNNMSDAMTYIFIIRCAESAYDIVYDKNPISYSANSWANSDTTSHKALRSVFEWLNTPNRKVQSSDMKYFLNLKKAMANSDKVGFQVKSYLLSTSFIDIIKNLVTGKIMISSEGELQ